MWRSARVVAVAIASCACSTLPDIPAGVCGNGVLDPTEDCDGFPREGLECRPPGERAQCRLDCSPSADGEPVACPVGYGCDADHVCRRATGDYAPLSDRILGRARSLESGDFNGDGRDDVLSLEPPITYGFSKIRAHYFDRAAAPTHTWTPSRAVSSPKPFVAS
jgi:hypothetical protein